MLLAALLLLAAGLLLATLLLALLLLALLAALLLLLLVELHGLAALLGVLVLVLVLLLLIHDCEAPSACARLCAHAKDIGATNVPSWVLKRSGSERFSESRRDVAAPRRPRP